MGVKDRRNVEAGGMFQIAGAAIVKYEKVGDVDGGNDEVDEDELLELGQCLGKEMYADVKLSGDLTPIQGEEVLKLLHEYQDICSEIPELLV